MKSQSIQFIRRGAVVTLDNVAADRTLLEVLREDLNCTGTKEGCGEGDCGACTVVLGEVQDGALRYRAVNSCIRLAHSIDGLALWTVEDLAKTPGRSQVFSHPPGGPGEVRAGGDDNGNLHPVQEAMVQCHGSQCGFCTPGFVMSLFGMYQNHLVQGRTITRELAQQELSGNLCRCTGYKPILDAAQKMADYPAMAVDEPALRRQLAQLRAAAPKPDRNAVYLTPRSLKQLLRARTQHPDAQIVAGCTDVGLWVTKMHMQFASVLDVTRVAELLRIERYPHHIAIGAAVTLSDGYAALIASRPQLQVFANRFAGLPVRNAGTLGGNVANGSPIGDSMPLLIALGANVVLMSLRGHRELPLESLYIGYRKNVMAGDEVLAWIKVPLPTQGEFSRVYKISKRFDDDISAICLALSLHIADGQVVSASIGVGGVAATPVRAVRTQAALTGKRWTSELVRDAIGVLRSEFQPISDMRASAAYRSEVLGNLLQRFWLESQGQPSINLESFSLQGEAA